MSVFDYTAVDRAGQMVRGEIEAETRPAAVDALSKQGQLAVEIVARGEAARRSTDGGRSRAQPNAEELTLLTRELSLLLGGGLSLSRALTAIETEADVRRVRTLAGRLRLAIAAGTSLNEALAAEAPIFSSIYVGMVKAAEASGTLVGVLARIADTREREQKLRAKITSALLYPSLLIATAIATVVVLFVYVVPRIKESLGDQVAQLPASSKAVFAASDWLQVWGQSLWVAAGAMGITLVLLWRQLAIQRFRQRLVLKLPVIGRLVRMSLTARFCRTLGVLLSSGLQLPAALALTRDVMGHEEMRVLIDRLGTAIREGEDFIAPLSRSGVFPSLVTSMLRTGAESGLLASSAERLADMYESKLEIALQRLVTVLEPTIILIISAFISIVVVSIMSAIMGMYDLTGT